MTAQPSVRHKITHCGIAGAPMTLLVDRTGIKFLGDGEWRVRKHSVQGRRQWRKVHLAMDTATSDTIAAKAASLSVLSLIVDDRNSSSSSLHHRVFQCGAFGDKCLAFLQDRAIAFGLKVG
jgi:hypothetical protein